MPITIEPITRRRFLQGTLGGVMALGGLSLQGATEKPEARSPDVLAFLSDIHIHQNKEHVVHNLNPFERFVQARQSIFAEPARPSRIVVTGDCAYDRGLKGDYATMIEGFAPFRESGIPVHLALGNHDNRREILHALAKYDGKPVPEKIPAKMTEVVELPKVNLFLIDSLSPGNVSGFLGEAQLKQLAEDLDRRKDKPALVFAHHNPMPKPKSAGALIDTDELMEVLKSRKQVKGYVYGHTHRWDVLRGDDGFYRINLPTTVWKWSDCPYGWILAELRDNGVTLTVRSLDPNHPKNGEVKKLDWRAG